jgi:creatinine amidohydrolase/Fe(II)-dependent formamide hydrolase-like protein
MTDGLVVHQALCAVATLGVADLLNAGQRSASALASALHVNEDALYRALRFLSGLGVFHESSPRTFVNTALSECLRSDVSGSIRPVLIFRGSRYYFTPFTEFLYSLETGIPARDKVFGQGAFEYLRSSPQEERVFDEAMTAISSLWAPAIAEAYDFGQWQTLTDVGGGNGVLLAAILRAHPALQGIFLPLGTDAMNATAQVFNVQQYLRTAGVDTIVGPPLNIGITNEGGDWNRDGTYAYPGSLTIRRDTFVALYVDVLRSLHDNGLRRAFLYIGHLGTRHVEAVVEVVQEANRTIEGMTVYTTVDSEMLDRMKLAPSRHILSVDKGRNFEMLAQLLGRGTELPRTTHADGAETSWTLYFHPEVVRPGYQRFAQSPSSLFLEVLNSGDRSKNPSGSGGFPFDRASADVGKKIVDYKTARIGEAILQVLRAK